MFTVTPYQKQLKMGNYNKTPPHTSQKLLSKYGNFPNVKENIWQNFSYELLIGKQTGHLGERNLTTVGEAKYICNV